MSSLPAEILSQVDGVALVNDVLLAVLSDALPGVDVGTLIAADQTFPFVLARAAPDWGGAGGDPRFVEAATVAVHTLCEGVEADSDADLLSEAARKGLLAGINKVLPSGAYLTRVELTQRPRRVPDWATATGPVQYADLPTGVVRYEALYRVKIRRPRS